MDLTADTEPLTERIDGTWYTRSEIEQKKATDGDFKEALEREEELNELLQAFDEVEVIAEPIIVKPEAETIIIEPELTNKNLHNRIREIWTTVANGGSYKDQDQKDFIEMGLILVQRHITYKPDGCRLFHKPTEAQGAFMNDSQILDLYQILIEHPNHPVDNNALDGMFANIFEGEFDFDQALDIAIGKYKDKNGKIGNLSIEQKIKYLNIPKCWQYNLVVLQSQSVKDKIKNDAVSLKKAQYKENANDAALITASIDIRHRLEIYAASSSSRMKSIDVYVNIWMSIQRNGGDKSKLVGIMKSYETFTESSITKTNLRRKILYLGKAGIL